MSADRRGRHSIWRRLVALLAAAVAGFSLARLLWYFRRIQQQPRLPPIVIGDLDLSADLTGLAYEIAERDLRAGLEVRTLEDGTRHIVLCAGARNFREPWARDTGFAAYGLLELGAFPEAKDALKVFLLTQSVSGQFPVKIHSTDILDRFLYSLFDRQQPIEEPIRPKYITAHNTVSLDGNALLVNAVIHYAEQTGDQDFVAEHWDGLARAMEWLAGHADDDDPLLRQAPFSDWADTISRTGKVLYTNVIYWKAVAEMGAAAARLGREAEARDYERTALELRKALMSEFWRQDLGYFVTSTFFDNLSSSGNLLAIAWGLASEEQAHRILDAMRFFGMAIPVPTKAVHRAYPRQFVAIENRVGGIADYHTYFAWLWLGAWHVIALARVGRMEEASELIYNMSRVIVRDGAVHEVYAPNGAYASNLWYTSESPLTWSAGMFVYALNVYRRRLGE
ncbi:MAG TPA: hypothetical protein VMN57_02615 [Anaerolineales bacterium]|nr:hypothetical protein [Anaerolineales bacterium]